MIPGEFPSVLAAGWALPKPEPFLDYFLPLIHASATFVQPMFRDARGIAEVEHMFRRLFGLLPDLVASPRCSAISGNTVFIESDCTATLGRHPVHFAVCDRFVIEDGLLIARRSYSDPLPVLIAAAGHPTSWPRLLRSRARGHRDGGPTGGGSA